MRTSVGALLFALCIPAAASYGPERKLQAKGAFLVSAIRKNGETETVTVYSEKGNTFRLSNPFDENPLITEGISDDAIIQSDEIIEIRTRPGSTIRVLQK